MTPHEQSCLAETVHAQIALLNDTLRIINRTFPTVEVYRELVAEILRLSKLVK